MASDLDILAKAGYLGAREETVATDVIFACHALSDV
jgi:hypothetical protein